MSREDTPSSGDPVDNDVLTCRPDPSLTPPPATSADTRLHYRKKESRSQGMLFVVCSAFGEYGNTQK